uniref:Wd repeat-containing protein 13-like n=1 Tax=Tetraselmis sp. GSL018 TaxID=582737 RepID=A0A061S135_9CHLO
MEESIAGNGASCTLDATDDFKVDLQALRNYLLRHDRGVHLIDRGKWNNGVANYAAYRQFLQLWGKGQLPDAEPEGTEADSLWQGSAPPEGGLSESAGSLEDAQTSEEDTAAHSRMSAALSFKDIEVVVEESEMPISVVKFARASSTTVAMGDEAGQVQIVEIGREGEPRVVQILEHDTGVADLDWSSTSTMVLTCCEDGQMVLWGTSARRGWQCLRTLDLRGSAICCRFHPQNENFVIVGSALGTVSAVNASTGATVSKHVLQGSSREGVFASAIDCMGALTFVGDSSGRLVVLDSSISGVPAVPRLTVAQRVTLPSKERAPVLSVQLSEPSCPGKDADLMTYQADGCLCLWSVALSQGRLARISRRLRAVVPAPSPYTNAVHTPAGSLGPSCSEAVTVGCLHPGVTIYNLSKLSEQSAPTALVQLQGHVSPVVALAWSHDKSILVAGDVEGSLILWRRAK